MNDSLGPASVLRLLRMLATLGAALVLVVIGSSAYLRLSQAGLSCADWPACYGNLSHAAEATSAQLVARIAHRIAASAVGFVLLALLAVSLTQRPRLAKQAVIALLALAEGSGALRVIACIDARLGEIYHAAYEKRAGEWRTRSEPTLCSPARAPELSGENWTGCGTGFAAHGEALGRVYQNKLSRVIPDALPHAREIAALAASQFGHGLGRDPALATPLYLRDKVALTTNERTR